MPIDVAEPPNRHHPTGDGFVRDPDRPVIANARRLAAGHGMHPHDHPRGQLLWPMQGVLRISSGASVWIVPPGHAVWIPGGTRHLIDCDTAVEIRNLHVDASLPVRAGREAGGCAVLRLTSLMQALILRLCGSDTGKAFPEPLRRLAAVALDELEALEAAPLSLPGGSDPRLERLTRHLGQNPADPRPLPVLAQIAGASPRTLERLFRQETGLTFRQWRSRLRLLAAIGLLERGESSTRIAYSLGYSTPSAFVAAFRTAFGETPQGFLGPGRDQRGRPASPALSRDSPGASGISAACSE